MYLKALEIQGFKSFPDKTVLNFGEDITAIVGPNGSGKSNVSDAIRWVMGEQSSKSLRGAKMEDVIFGGTEKRSQMGFAQVTLVLDNTEHIFPRMEESEVAVTRRYYRSGESEYYINKQSVRLRDVNELFMDTGMGREGYSIVGQGKIDEILSVKSADRREIFEEAAGISKFRHRKEETERKLERTEENLVRINDKIAELELQVGPLRSQAEKAKKYLILRDELRTLEISVWLENLDKIKTDSIKLNTDYALAQQELERANAALDELYAASEQFAEKAHANDMEQERLRTECAELDAKRSEEDAAVAVLRTGIEHNRASIERVENDLRDQSGRAESLTAQIAAKHARIEELAAQTAELEEELRAFLAQAEELARTAGEAGSEVEALRAREALAASDAADCRADMSAMNAGLAELSERCTALEAESESVDGQLTEKRRAASASRRALEEAQEEADAVRNIISGHTLKMEGRVKREETARQKSIDLTMEKNNLDSRIHLLSEMEKEYEGFNKAVRLIMQAAEKNTLRGVHGPVANLMTTDKRYAVAIEIALGAGMQNVVVDREEDAKSAINFLKQRDGGRATFLPLTAIRGDVLREAGVEREYGYVGVASQLVQFDKRYAEIFNNLLGRTVVVEDMDCGIAIARKYGSRFRIVTLDGQVLNRGGSMTGGSVSRSAGILSRANELKELTARREALTEKLDAALREADEAKRDLNAAQYELDVAREQQRGAEDAVLRLTGEKKQYDMLLESLRARESDIAAELESITARTAELKKAAAAREEEIKKHEAEAARCRAESEEKLAGQNELQRDSAHLGDEIAARKSTLAGFTAERETTERALGDLETLAQQMRGDEDGRRALIEDYRAKIKAAEEEIAQHDAVTASLRADAEKRRAELAELAEAKLALEGERSANDRRYRECNELLSQTQAAAGRLEQKRVTAAMEEKQILDKLWESYELSHSAAQEQRIELESVPKASRRINELKREINGLGNVNVGAIEEFDRVNTRYTYLTGQRDDVEKAKEELLGVIENITSEMTVIFKEQFALIRESFQETFLELFGGGKATLELEDENAVLDCGIEIKVQPPGKALKTLSLLSGGEKAFVAIALYFAILKVHPTPFCVMDEIEAALDEPNVIRVAHYMRRICDKTQFIVITHRRGTMEAADVLYGVTMQERGVSKVLTINMNDMAKELNIKG
ncbi:chromosome segregation protein SMC [Oscillibacter sp. MSJ-31]|uniref:chromosome segregation protein SMC n=1 Tax=Oscillibacter sp. MSJ-31 TaxID=2841526 RepID=UPI001C101224|nr:chromosome segregation protein SMC [Oscillibacter sp. MSJ-31]MBU5456589.1 chromosome segregation protein SMC [Oscillibacter sp. MSJ-31]